VRKHTNAEVVCETFCGEQTLLNGVALCTPDSTMGVYTSIR
jgi:hypothetical protein